MKKMTKIVSIVAVAALIFACFSGCGKKESSSDTIKIGGIGPLTGGAAIYGHAA